VAMALHRAMRFAGLTVTASAPMSGPTATTLSCGGNSDPTEFWFNRQLMQGHWAACDHINTEACILQDDEVGRHFADARIWKQCQGVDSEPALRDQPRRVGSPASGSTGGSHT